MTVRHTPMPMKAAAPRGLITRLGVTATDTYSETDDIDWIAVERTANADYNPALLNQAELRETAILLGKAGLRERAISSRLFVYERRIGEWLAAAGLLPPDRICSRDGCGHVMAGRRLCTKHLQLMRKHEKRAREAAAQNMQNLGAAA